MCGLSTLPRVRKKEKKSHQNNSVCPKSSRLGSLEPAGSASSDGRDYRMIVAEQVGPAGWIERNTVWPPLVFKVASVFWKNTGWMFLFLPLPSFYASGVKCLVPASCAPAAHVLVWPEKHWVWRRLSIIKDKSWGLQLLLIFYFGINYLSEERWPGWGRRGVGVWMGGSTTFVINNLETFHFIPQHELNEKKKN